MKAAIFEKSGLENLKIQDDVEQPKITDHDVLIRVKAAGVNPFDHITISGTREIKPLPHIPGAETTGEIEKIFISHSLHLISSSSDSLLFIFLARIPIYKQLHDAKLDCGKREVQLKQLNSRLFSHCSPCFPQGYSFHFQ